MNMDNREMREVYAETLVELAKSNPNICVVEADLVNCIKTMPFQKAYPERFFNVGIAEANMVGISAGLATCGKIPFCSSFGPFATRRSYDQVFISIAYSKQNVKIVGTDPGVCAEYNGGTHMPFEDMALMTSIPDMVCVEPTDSAMLRQLLPQIAQIDKPVYIRLLRKKANTVYDDQESFDLNKAKVLRQGKDATIICSGIMVAQAIQAGEQLAKEGIEVTILNTFTWKPIDEDAIIQSSKNTNAIVVAENHNRINGLFAMVADVVARNYPTIMESVGVQDRFGQVGKLDYLMKEYGLTSDDIVKATKKAIARKNSK